MGFDYNFDRDTKHVTVPEAGKRRRWMFAAVFTVILVGLVICFRPSSSESAAVPDGESQTAASDGGGAPSVGTSDVPATAAPDGFSAEQSAGYREAEGLIGSGGAVKAAGILSGMLKSLTPYSAGWEKAALLLTRANIKIMMDKLPCARNVEYTVKAGDTLNSITRKNNNMCNSLLLAANRIDNKNQLRPGQRLTIYNVKAWSLEISRSRQTLSVFADGELFAVYPAGVSSGVASGEAYYKSREELSVGEDHRDYNGTRKMGLSNNVDIHGTWVSGDVRSPFRDGGIRMKNSDIEELYIYLPMLRTTKVKIID